MESAQALTLARLDVVADALEAASKHPEDAEAIHDLRVATRRFGQCLRVFEAAFDAHAIQTLRRRMKKWMKRCGEVRNCDITLELLRETGFGARSGVARQVRELRANAERRLEKSLAKTQRRDVRTKWTARLMQDGTAGAQPPDLAALTEELFQQGAIAAAPGTGYEAMHRFRLAAKRYRYTVELFGGKAAEPVLDGMKALQDRLGAMNDCVTALELVKGHSRAERAIADLLQRRTGAFRRHWKREFGNRRLQEWTSIFSAMAKRNPAQPALRKRPARLRSVDERMSAAS